MPAQTTPREATGEPVAGDEPRPSSRLLQLYPALENSSFRLLWLGMLPASLAWQMSVVTTGYAALTISGSATAIGLASSAMGLPMLLLSLVGGVVADLMPRRRVLIATQSVLGLASAILAGLTLAGLLQVWHLVALGLVQGMAFSFNMPARQAFIGELVGPRLLRSAVALNNAGMNFCRILGPAMAGGLLAVPAVGVAGVFATMAIMYGAVLVSLFRLPSATSSSVARRQIDASGLEQLVEGLRYIRSSPVLVALLGMALVTVFFGMPYQQLMPLFSERVFQVGAAGLGMLMAAVGVGALAGSISVAALANFPRPGLLQMGVGTGFGLTLMAFALSPSFQLAIALLVVVGFTSASHFSLNNTLIMANTEPRLHGRVMSVYLMTFAVMPIATLPMAWLADQIGERGTVAAAGFVVASLTLGVAALYPPYRRIR